MPIPICACVFSDSCLHLLACIPGGWTWACPCGRCIKAGVHFCLAHSSQRALSTWAAQGLTHSPMFGQGPTGALMRVCVVWVAMRSDFLCMNVNNTNKYTRVWGYIGLIVYTSAYICVYLYSESELVSWMCICESENIKSELTVGLESLCSLPTFKAVTSSENQLSILQYFQ